MTDKTQHRAEFSRPLSLDAVGYEGLFKEIEASDRERAALAKRFGLLALGRLRAELRISRREEIGILLVEGRIEAEVTQTCVVTLEPVTSRLVERVEWQYDPDPVLAAAESDGPSDPMDLSAETEAEDPPEAVGPDGIDLGEAVAQQLSVALDPYPRSEGAALSSLEWPDPDGSGEGRGPFAALEALRRKA